MTDVFPLVHAAQRLHGLRFSDYRRYRGHCASRIRNLRRSLGFQQIKNRRYKAVSLPETPKDIRVLEIYIFEAERSWASAQELLVAAATSDRPGVGKIKHHAQRRLARAVRHATALVQAIGKVLVADCPFTDAQCSAYLYAFKAEWHTLRNDAASAGKALEEASFILRKLRIQHPLEVAYSTRLNALDVLRKSLHLPNPRIDENEISDLQQCVHEDLEIIQNFLKRPHKFKGGFLAAERLEKLYDLIGNSVAQARMMDVKRLFVSRSFAVAGRFQEAYTCIRCVRVHEDVDGSLFPGFPAALQRCRLSVGSELLKDVVIGPEEVPLEVAEGLEEEKGLEEEQVRKPAGVTGFVGKMTSWFSGGR